MTFGASFRHVVTLCSFYFPSTGSWGYRAEGGEELRDNRGGMIMVEMVVVVVV